MSAEDFSIVPDKFTKKSSCSPHPLIGEAQRSRENQCRCSLSQSSSRTCCHTYGGGLTIEKELSKVVWKEPRAGAWRGSLVYEAELQKFKASMRQTRESSDNPILNAFCRVAPSVRFRDLAILRAGVFFFASDLSSRTCTDVQARLFFPFFI